MGQRRTDANGTAHNSVAHLDDMQKARFAEHFPKLFAYVLSWTGDEKVSRDIVIEAFSRVFGRATPASDEDFAIALYGVTRDLCSGVRKSYAQGSNDLNDPEREVLALLFDAQLTRGQVSSLLKMPETKVAATLVNGLRKLKRVALEGSRPKLQQQV